MRAPLAVKFNWLEKRWKGIGKEVIARVRRLEKEVTAVIEADANRKKEECLEEVPDGTYMGRRMGSMGIGDCTLAKYDWRNLEGKCTTPCVENGNKVRRVLTFKLSGHIYFGCCITVVLKVIIELVLKTLLGGFQGSKSCTFPLNFIFPEVGDLEVRLAPAAPAVLGGHPCWCCTRAIRLWKPSSGLEWTCSLWSGNYRSW